MSTTNKTNKGQKRSVNQSSSPATTPSLLSNYKFWLASCLIIVVISFAIQRQTIDKTNKTATEKERLFTSDELRTYTKDELYLAILGHVFNVSSAPRFYSSTGGYKFYTGRDASRSFHTGKSTEEDLTDDLTGLNDEAVASVYDWLAFYQKQYPQIGKLIGRYFDANGAPTKHFQNVLVSVDHMKKKEEEKATFEQKWPPCNSEWSHDTGRRVWCTDKSGGVQRTWIGFPRRYFDSSLKTERCVCVQNSDKQDGRFKEYDNCLSTSNECRLPD
ncbi:unnamed protein product [Adineta ricciae]|uniref:Cytochrome b5 heme-binding domain-containing protein n=1 Tax=Adineta ricciae TaxID=249248 RepID=A0A815FTC7_ADIRI|nr:unnamed protein product [Adineta ricciae]CAF1324118.1 unnamed protein product [Adineta ricciae]